MDKKKLDLSTITSMTLSVAMIFSSIAIEGQINSFANLPAALIVVMGTLLVTISCFSFGDIISSLSVIYRSVFFEPRTRYSVVTMLLIFSENARKLTSLKNLDQILNDHHSDHFFSKAITMVSDGMVVENIEKILHQEINSNIDLYNKNISILKKAAETAPAMGLIGTLIGLVQMLRSLSNPGELGPSMAIALLTTFYGAVLSYMIFSPLAAKIEHNAREETLIQMLYLKAAISIARKENPRHLETTLNSLLDSSNKITYYK